MKQNLIGLPQRYAAALRRHIAQGAGASMGPALKLGEQAVSLGLETLELAQIHETAVATLGLAAGETAKRADSFFSKATTPIVEAHRAARENRMELAKVAKALGRRTQELAVSAAMVKEGVVRRLSAEAALAEDTAHHARLLRDSLQLQESLRLLAHQVLVAQEKERLIVSHQLQDEIAQTLLGINVRLLTLKEEAGANTRGLRRRIANAQRLVTRSARSSRRVTRGAPKS